MSEKTIGMTVTGEIFQPVRLYYSVLNRQEVENCLMRLRCIEEDASQKRWVWLYRDEAQIISFKNDFHCIPEEVSPIVIGSFIWKNDESLILDVRSFERALEAIPFFDKYVPRSLAKIKYCAVVNRIFAVAESIPSNFDIFFEDNDKLVEINPEAFMDRAREGQLSKNDSPNIQAITSFLDNEMDRFFEVEKFPVHFYEDGLTSLKGSFILRQIIAMERWKGDTTYSFKNVFNKMFTAMRS